MQCYLQTFRTVLAEAGSDWVKHNASQLGAAIAFFGVLSLAPLLGIALRIGSLVVKPQSANEHLFAQLTEAVGSEGAHAIRDLLTHSPQPAADSLTSLASLAVLLFAASGVFGSLQVALNTIWETPPSPRTGLWTFLFNQLLALMMVLAMGLLLLFSLTLSAVIAAVGRFVGEQMPSLEPLLHLGDIGATLLVVTILFAITFKLLTPVRVAWRDVAIGAGVTAALFTIGKVLIGIYLGKSGIASAYGAAGSLMVVVVWIYYSAQILLFGAELTQAFAHHCGSRAPGAKCQ